MNCSRVICGASRRNMPSCLPSAGPHGIGTPLFFESQYFSTSDLKAV